MMDHFYQDSRLKKYIGKTIPVTAIYESLVLDTKSDKDTKYVLLADIRSIGGDLLRNHIWSPEILAFKVTGLEKGSIIRFDGKVSEYSKGKGPEEIGYTLGNILNVKLINNRLSSREMCDSCEYKKNTKDLEWKNDDYRKKNRGLLDNVREITKDVTEHKSSIKKLKEENKDLSKKSQHCPVKDLHVINFGLAVDTTRRRFHLQYPRYSFRFGY